MFRAINPGHPMTQLATENALKLLFVTIWKLRQHCPNLAVELTWADMAEATNAFGAGQQPCVGVIGKREAIVLQLMDAATGQMLVTSENDENSPNAKMMKRMLYARRRAPEVAERLVKQADAATVQEAAELLKLLTWEPAS